MSTQIFNIAEEYKCYDLSEMPKVEDLVTRLKVNAAKVRLDVRRCMIDYPATSRIVDCVLDQLEQTKGVKSLEVLTDFLFPQDTLLNALLSGSEYFSLEDVRITTKEEIEKRIRQRIAKTELTFLIRVVDLKEKTIREYLYARDR